VFDRDVATFDKAAVAEPFSERRQIGRGGLERTLLEIPDHRHCRLLRAYCKRPRDRRAAPEQGNELPPSHAALPPAARCPSTARPTCCGGPVKSLGSA